MHRHRHEWRELLQRGGHDRTAFVICDKCENEGRDTAMYLSTSATSEFRRQIKHGIKPRFIKNVLIARNWKDV